jgi:hypothetical protein
MLEDDFVGPLYKTILQRPGDKKVIEKQLLGPQAISVSKVNLIVSIFTIVIWLALFYNVLPKFHLASPISWKHLAIGLMTLFFAIFMSSWGKTHLGPHDHVMTRRETKII